MEHLVCDLKEHLILRRKNEIEKIQKLDTENDKKLILISSGKILELDHLISYLDDMLHYHNVTKNITR